MQCCSIIGMKFFWSWGEAIGHNFVIQSFIELLRRPAKFMALGVASLRPFGWSGKIDKNLSSVLLKVRGVEDKSLMYFGKELNNMGPSD